MASEYPANAGDPMAMNTETKLSTLSDIQETSAFHVQHSLIGLSTGDHPPEAPNGNWNIRAIQGSNQEPKPWENIVHWKSPAPPPHAPTHCV